MSQAQQDLAAAQLAWQSEVVAYWQAVADYQVQASAYSSYAASVRQVAQAWDRITAQRQAYADAVAAYNLAVDARQRFLLDQAAAQTAYDDAVAACVPGGDTTSTPPVPPVATPTDLTTPTGGPSPTVPATPVCPPPVPDILGQVAPTVPPLPTPPPDPRPTG